MKKYSHLFLFVVLLNATSNAQNIQSGNQKATAPAITPKGLSKTGAAALQSLGKAAAVLAPMTAEIAVPANPLYSPVSPATDKAPSAKERELEIASAGPTSIMSIMTAPISGRGVRNRVSNRLKGQTTGSAKIDEFIVAAATRYGIEPLLLFSVMSQESAFKSQAISPKGARGLMQLMPATAARFGVKDIFDPEQNIHAGARYLRFLLDLFDGDISLALAGYNAGEGAVEKSGNQVPDYKETKNYVKKITVAYGKTHHPVLAPAEAAERFGVAEVLAE
jgi:soluble lytic murein transglycosylase-like protein